ncbi:MAG: hypothetical protein IPN28_12865 [Alphaproteobacteria bacterium]|nr:MAG: hypothetical protein IPN28_12865 [Alphaproteobacteria bacterium]
MNIFARITATLTGKLDEMVSHVENHDAVVAVALKDTCAAAAKAKVRLERVHRDGEAMHKRLQEAMRMERLWENRAKETAAKDEQKPLLVSPDATNAANRPHKSRPLSHATKNWKSRSEKMCSVWSSVCVISLSNRT